MNKIEFWLFKTRTTPCEMGVNFGSCFSFPTELAWVHFRPPVGKAGTALEFFSETPRLMINLVFSVYLGTVYGGQSSHRGMLPLSSHILPWTRATTVRASAPRPRTTTWRWCFTKLSAMTNKKVATTEKTSATATSRQRRGFICGVTGSTARMLKRRRKREAAKNHRKVPRRKRCVHRRFASETSRHLQERSTRVKVKEIGARATRAFTVNELREEKIQNWSDKQPITVVLRSFTLYNLITSCICD